MRATNERKKRIGGEDSRDGTGMGALKGRCGRVFSRRGKEGEGSGKCYMYDIILLYMMSAVSDQPWREMR